MEQGKLAFTAVYLKATHGYIGFIEELPGVNSHGRTIEEARATLHKLAAVIFDEVRRGLPQGQAVHHHVGKQAVGEAGEGEDIDRHRAGKWLPVAFAAGNPDPAARRERGRG